MKNFFKILFCAAVTVIGFACADSTKEGYYAKEERSFEEYMKGVVAQSGDIEKLDNGVYVEWLERAPAGAREPESGDWIRINYRNMTLVEGYIFVTRYAEDARRLGSFQYYTQYVPQQLPNNIYNGLTTAEIEALKHMKEGDSVMIYSPSRYAYAGYAPTYYNGYEGQERYTLTGNTNIRFNMKLEQVITDITAFENNIVEQVAQNSFGIADLVRDTLRMNAYLDAYRKNIDPAADPKDTVLVRNDSTVKLYYITRFAEYPDFIIDTNIDSVGQRFYHDKTKLYSVLSYAAASNATSSAINKPLALYQAVNEKKVTYNNWYRVVFNSDYGFGSDGLNSMTSSAGATVIQPYTPLIYEFYVAPANYGDDDDDDAPTIDDLIPYPW